MGRHLWPTSNDRLETCKKPSMANTTHRKWSFLNDPRVLFASRYSRYQAFPVPSTPGWRITMEDLETDHDNLERKDDASNWLPLNRVIPSKATQPSKLGVTALGVLWSRLYFKSPTSNASPATTSCVWIHGRLLQIKNLLSTEKCSREFTGRRSLDHALGNVWHSSRRSSIRHQSLYVQNFYAKSKSLKKDQVGTRKCYATHCNADSGRVIEDFHFLAVR